jgi:uncharacterized membrane protein
MIGCAIVAVGCRSFGDAYRELARSSGINDFDNAAKWYRYGVPLFSYGARLLDFVGLPLLVIVGAILIIVGHIYALLGYRKLWF